jgi:arginase
MVADALSHELLPLIIGGDCTITLGVLAAIIDSRSDVGVVYIDGSPDLNTPDDSPTGILDSMGAAHMLGLGDLRLRAVGPRDPMISADQIAFFGHERAVMNPAEAERLAGHVAGGGLSMSVAEARPTVGASARAMAAALEDRCGALLVHFDVDVIDAIDFPGGNVAQFNTGLSFAEAADALAACLASPNLGAVVVTEFNPQRDPDGDQARRLADALATGLRIHAPGP